MRFVAPSVVCPRCGHESPPSGQGRFMTCAKCGMSIDADAGERQEAVRGRVKEKPEIEIDPSLPNAPSKFPLVPAILATVVLLGGLIAVVVYLDAEKRERQAEEERERFYRLLDKQGRWFAAYSVNAEAHESFACRHLDEVVRRPCKDSVRPEKLAFDEAHAAIERPETCGDAVAIFLASRVDADCD